MIVLDTNIISQRSKPAPDAKVREWMNTYEEGELLITAITVAELRYGVAIMDDGRKKIVMAKNVDETLDQFAGVCLAFDGMAAEEYALILASRKAAGRPISIHDAQIAAIARSGGFTLATLNKKDFDGIDGLHVVDPSA
jgi:predicted nucleic acid-binding protein